MSRNDGGPAFPADFKTRRALPNNQIVVDLPSTGMTLRDYFAAKAMQAMNTNPYWDDKDFSFIAEKAYAQADAMLAERERAV